jgi:hypothetical protein
MNRNIKFIRTETSTYEKLVDIPVAVKVEDVIAYLSGYCAALLDGELGHSYIPGSNVRITCEASDA